MSDSTEEDSYSTEGETSGGESYRTIFRRSDRNLRNIQHKRLRAEARYDERKIKQSVKKLVRDLLKSLEQGEIISVWIIRILYDKKTKLY